MVSVDLGASAHGGFDPPPGDAMVLDKLNKQKYKSVKKEIKG